ncbi:MAG: response regulator transcription factor [Bacteroidota bacterium]|jgi:two-component system alkaline phosphatase synthesis response regulator PhoP|nr:response regulator transcription factor [Bacteroidota bacterium]
MKTVLIIEDDPAILAGLEAGLRAEHYAVTTESDGARGLERARKLNPDIIILDLMLPSLNGEEICRALRAGGCVMPILMLTAKGSETDKVLGLELGADDYMTKPFSLRELQARIKALLRRAPVLREPEEYAVGELWINLRTREVRLRDRAVDLTAREFDVLRYFILHANELVTRDMLLDEVWGYDQYPTTRTVDNYILALRKKIEITPSAPRYIVTVHTAGYRLVGALPS